jgi:hypothetical protein
MAISASQSRARVIKLVIGAVIGIVLGAILGGFAFSVLSSETTATALIRITQPADLVAIAAGAGQTTPNTQDNTERYVAGEVAYLSGTGFADAVGEKMGKSGSADIKIVQDGRSSMVAVSSTSASSNDAIRTAQAAIDLYDQQLAQRTDQQLRIVLPALAQWEQNADEAGAAEIRQLRDKLRIQAAQASTVSVLQPPTAADASPHRALIGAMLGALAGGALVVLVLLGRSRRSGPLSPDPEIGDAVDGVLVPVVDVRQPPRESWGETQAALARTLYAQLPSPGPSRTIVVIGASQSSGTAVIAALLQLAAAEHGPAEAVTLAQDPLPGLAPTDPPTTLVIDAGAMGDSKSTPEAIAAATDLIVVGRLGADTLSQTLVVRSATAASDAPLLAVFTSGAGKAAVPRRG